jgi:hypothetical protein
LLDSLEKVNKSVLKMIQDALSEKEWSRAMHVRKSPQLLKLGAFLRLIELR